MQGSINQLPVYAPQYCPGGQNEGDDDGTYGAGTGAGGITAGITSPEPRSGAGPITGAIAEVGSGASGSTGPQ